MEPSTQDSTVSWNSHASKPQLLSAFLQFLGGENLTS